MNRLTEYIKSQTAVRDELHMAEVCINRKDQDAALRHLLHSMRALLVAQNNVVHIAYKRKAPKSKMRPVKAVVALALFGLLAGSAQAFDHDKNPDRFTSIGLDVSSGKLPGILKDSSNGAPHTDGGFVKGLLDIRVPISDALSVHAFGSSTGVNNNLQFSEGSEVGVGLRVFIQ